MSSGPLFSSYNLLSAGEYYHWTESGDPDRGELPYQQILLHGKNLPPSERVDDCVEWLVRWGGLRGTTKRKARLALKSFVKEFEDDLVKLRSKSLAELGPSQLHRIGRLAESLSGRGLKPTTYGKALHFFMPDTVLMWDDWYVRSTYRLREDDKENRAETTSSQFERYQWFGWRLIRLLIESEGDQIVATIHGKHRATARCDEPVTKILDEMVYDGEGNRERAVAALGGLDRALAPGSPP